MTFFRNRNLVTISFLLNSSYWWGKNCFITSGSFSTDYQIIAWISVQGHWTFIFCQRMSYIPRKWHCFFRVSYFLLLLHIHNFMSSLKLPKNTKQVHCWLNPARGHNHSTEQLEFWKIVYVKRYKIPGTMETSNLRCSTEKAPQWEVIIRASADSLLFRNCCCCLCKINFCKDTSSTWKKTAKYKQPQGIDAPWMCSHTTFQPV